MGLDSNFQAFTTKIQERTAKISTSRSARKAAGAARSRVGARSAAQVLGAERYTA